MSDERTVEQALLEGIQKSKDHILSQSWTTRDGKVFDNRAEALKHMQSLQPKPKPISEPPLKPDVDEPKDQD